MRVISKTYNLGEVAELKNGKSRPEKEGAYPVYGGNGILGYTDKFNVDNETIIIGRVGAYCGAVYFESNKSWISDNALYAKPHKGFDSKYLFYLLKYKNLNQYAGGSSHPLLTQGRLNELKVEVPPLHTQTRIVSILSALDDKIELNRQTNHTMEAIAQAIFKEWFVDFNFPHSPLEGWQAKPDGVESFLRPCPTGGGVNSLQAKPATLPSWQKNSLFPFWTLPKNHKLKERAKELRKQRILSEVVFWKAFKDKKKLGWDIDRQVIIGNFIVDFFIPELGLVFEIDGSSHNDKQEYDQERDAFLSSLQLKVVRISDKDVLRNIEGVWSFVTESIKNRVEELEEKSPPRPSGTPQEGNNPPRQALPATPQEGKKCEMQDSELGPIPKGWRVGRLGDICKNSINTIHPKEIKSDTAYVGLEHILRKSLGLISWGASGDVDSQKKHFKKYDVLFGKLRPYFHKVCIAPLDGICSTDILVIKPQKNGFFSFCLNHLFSNALITYVSSIADGTRMPRVDWNSISNYEIVLPPEKLVSQFNKTTFPFYDAIIENNQQSVTLAAIRDALLPKIMNGEIEV